MNDMRAVLMPKSDQINADDLVGGPMTITIREVRISAGQEQPISVYFEGSDKAYRPCKTMGRLMMEMWGPDASKYLGHSLTLYRDPTVKFGKDAVGGVRVSHMTGIDERKVVMLTATRGQRKPHAVMPLVVDAPQPDAASKARDWAGEHKEAIDDATTAEDLDAIEKAGARAMVKLAKDYPDLHAEVIHAYSVRRSALSQEGKPDEDRGEAFGEDGGFADGGEGN